MGFSFPRDNGFPSRDNRDKCDDRMWERFGGREGIGKIGKVIVVLWVGLRQGEVAEYEFIAKGGKQDGEAAVSDLAEDGGLSEVFKIGHKERLKAEC